MPKIRLDHLLVGRRLADTGSRAQALIAAGRVYSGEVRLDKPGHAVAEDIPLTVRGTEHPWVSRGGMKLAHAMAHFDLTAAGKTCLDVGASTGGFTDVLLSLNATKVYAVDVGHGQLDWKLRQDPRVMVMEQCNARHLTPALIPDPLDLIVCDASFIGLRTVLPAPLALAADRAHLIALIKPQFEVGKGRVGKGGVVREAELHREVCDTIRCWLDGLEGWHVLGITQSPVTGPKGNIEFLIAGEKA